MAYPIPAPALLQLVVAGVCSLGEEMTMSRLGNRGEPGRAGTER
jgi:hypothetical protein